IPLFVRDLYHPAFSKWQRRIVAHELRSLPKSLRAVWLPMVKALWQPDPVALLIAVDLIALEPVSGMWTSLTKLHDGVLGPTESLADDGPLRLFGSLAAWLAGGGSTVPGCGGGVVILDETAADAENLLLNWRLICDTEAHAEVVSAMQTKARKRAL